MDPKKFKHRIQLQVRNFEVDWQGIVHNALSLQYFETARIEYLRQIGMRIDMHSINNESMIVIVRNEIDYRSPARFDELLNIHTRMAKIGKTSFVLEGYITEETSGRLISENIAYHTWLDPKNGRPTPVSDEFRRKIKDFEGSDAEIIWPPFKQ